jgi:cytochrome c5
MKSLTLTFVVCAATLLAACGKQDSAAPAAPVPAAAPAPAPAVVAVAAPDNAAGKSAFNKTCAMCHSTGTAGAPKPGDKADWGPRIAQGVDTLYKHAIDGYTGSKGQMPARGGVATLADTDVKAAVNYMVDASR